MSRIGRIPVAIPKEIKFTAADNSVQLEGPKGKMFLGIPRGIKVEQKDGTAIVNRENDLKQSRANQGTIRALIISMIEGVTKGHKRELEVQGVGFRVQMKGDTLILNLGFSHPVEYKFPKEIKLTAPQPTQIVVEGVDKALVGKVAAEIRDIKPPEPYKGKGIRYAGEQIRRKQGKSVTK